MATTEKTNRAVERLAESTRDSYQTVVDHAVGLQERNVRFAQGMVDGAIKELRYQAESNRTVAGELFERAEQGGFGFGVEGAGRFRRAFPGTALSAVHVRTIVRAMAAGEHLSLSGFDALKARALTMNGGGRYRRVHRG